MSAKTTTTPAQSGQYPEGAILHRFVRVRNSVGNFWWLMFLFSIIVGIIALIALLYNIINSAFGLTVIENQADPQALVLAVQEEKMLNAPNLVSSEDDNE